MKVLTILFCLCALFFLGCGTASKSSSQLNKLEYKFPDVANLPIQKGLSDPFLMANGKRVESSQDWLRQRDYLKAMLVTLSVWPDATPT